MADGAARTAGPVADKLGTAATAAFLQAMDQLETELRAQDNSRSLLSWATSTGILIL